MKKTLAVLRKAYLIAAVILMPASSFLLPKLAMASTPYQASDVIGQTDPSGNPSFTNRNSDNQFTSEKGFNFPSNTALDTVHHRLFVSDLGNNRVLVYNLDSGNNLINRTPVYVLGQPDFISSTGRCGYGTNPTHSSFCSPEGLVYDPANNRLFVADVGAYRILVFDVTSITNDMDASYELGQPNFSAYTPHDYWNGGITPYGFSYRPGIEIDSAQQHFFVSDPYNNRILVFDLSSGITDGMDASWVLGQSDFTSSHDTNNVNYYQHSLNSPYGETYDPASHLLFVSSSSDTRVVIYDLSSGISTDMDYVHTLGDVYQGCSYSGGVTANHFCYPGGGMAYDSANKRFFVVDMQNNRVLVFDFSSGITDDMDASWVLGQPDLTTGGNCNGSLATQKSLCINDYSSGLTYNPTTNQLYVNDSNNNRILIFDTTTVTNNMNAVDVLGQTDGSGNPIFTANFVNNIPAPNAQGMGLTWSGATPIDTVNHRLFATDYSNCRVLVYDLDSNNNLIDHTADHVLGAPSLTTKSDCSTSKNTLSYTSGVVYDAVNSRLFVLDGGNDRVVVYDLSAGITDGMDASYVLGQPDFNTSEYHCIGFSSPDTPTAGGLCTCDGNIAYDSDHQRLFVTDACNNRVVIYDLSSGITSGMDASWVLGQSSLTGDNQDNCPWGAVGNPSANSICTNFSAGLLYDNVNQRLFVDDSYYGGRILVFDLSAGITDGMDASYELGQPDFTTADGGSAQNTLATSTGSGLGYNPLSQTLFVNDSGNARILTFDLSNGITSGMDASGVIGQPDFTSSSPGVSQTQINNGAPSDFDFDSVNNRIYFLDGFNYRMLVFNFALITTKTLPDSAINSSYSQTLTTSGTQGTKSFSLASGTLPTGLTLNGTTGVISGTPTSAGTYNFSIKLADDNGTAGTFTDTKDYSVTITTGGTSSGSSGSSDTSSSTTTNSNDSGSTTQDDFSLSTDSIGPVVLNDFNDFNNGNGQSVDVSPGDTLLFCLKSSSCIPSNSDAYNFTVKDINKDAGTATLTLRPSNAETTLHKGISQNIDANQDSKPDIKAKLTGFTNSGARIVFANLVKASSTSTTNNTSGSSDSSVPNKSRVIEDWWIILLVIVLLVSGKKVWDKTAKHQKKNPGKPGL